MAKIYVRKINRAKEQNPDEPDFTLEDVPERWRKAVEELLEVG